MNVNDLQGIRKKLKLKQSQLADILNVSQSHFSALETGKNRMTDKMKSDLIEYAESSGLQLEANEDEEIYRTLRHFEIENFDECDRQYKVTSHNEVAGYKEGMVLGLRKITDYEAMPVGFPYVIVTLADDIEFIRYIVDIDQKGITISLDLTPTGKQKISIEKIKNIYAIKYLYSRRL